MKQYKGTIKRTDKDTQVLKMELPEPEPFVPPSFEIPKFDSSVAGKTDHLVVAIRQLLHGADCQMAYRALQIVQEDINNQRRVYGGCGFPVGPM